MRRTYAEVGSISETARRHRRSEKTVTRHLRAEGVKITPRRLDLDSGRIVRMYVEGRLSLRAIAARVGVSYGTVHRVIADAGVMRRRGSSGSRSGVVHRRTAPSGGEPADGAAPASEGTPALRQWTSPPSPVECAAPGGAAHSTHSVA